MADARRALTVLPERYAICRLEGGALIPDWVAGDGFTSITRTADETSVVCPEGRVPEGVRAERGWRAFRVEGPLEFSLTGILASLASPLAEAGISLFAVSTYDTDYVLVRAGDMERAVEVLAGTFDVRRTGGPDPDRAGRR